MPLIAQLIFWDSVLLSITPYSSINVIPPYSSALNDYKTFIDGP